MENEVVLSKAAVADQLSMIVKAAITRFSSLANATVDVQSTSTGDVYGTVEKKPFVCIYFNIWKGRFSIESTRREYDDAVIWIAEEVSRILGMNYHVAVTDPALVKKHMDKCPYCGHGEKKCQNCGAPI